MINFNYRTESIRNSDILNYFVENSNDRKIIDFFKSASPTIIEGSRGVGKSFLMQVAFAELINDFQTNHILPVYVTFRESSLLHSKRDSLQFRHWMIAKIIRETLKVVRKQGIALTAFASTLLQNQNDDSDEDHIRVLNKIIRDYENSFNNPDKEIDIASIPNIDDLIEAFEEICENTPVERVCIFFDEAAHMFRPNQQREFFSLYRELRSPFVSCNAAVYPGVTHYGSSFEMTHDTTFRRLERDINDPDYLKTMTEMVFKQLSEPEKQKIESQQALFNTLAFSSSGNPRMLFTTISNINKWNTTNINDAIKSFYRTEIWTEHTKLGEKYLGHKALVDWGRSFLEEIVIPETMEKNQRRAAYNESTIYFRVHKDVPEFVKESLRLLCYIGIIRKMDEGVKGSHSFIGTRYEIKYGCILSEDANPARYSPSLKEKLKLSLISEYGVNNPAYKEIPDIDLKDIQDTDILNTLIIELDKPIDILKLPHWQKSRLKTANITTIKSLLEKKEEDLRREIYMVGYVRARRIFNAANAELLEFLSG